MMTGARVWLSSRVSLGRSMMCRRSAGPRSEFACHSSIFASRDDPPAMRLVGWARLFDRHERTIRACDPCGPQARCRQSPLPGCPGARLFESGSSPVSSRYACGICRRRATPSFCLRTSQWAFAVRGEMPSRSPTSSLEQPAAINSTTCFCRGVRTGGLSCIVVDMAATLTTASSLANCPKDVFHALRR